ncbi:hypothetical protein REC12_18795 [Desulfosporosinus sp. PR]|uniref:DUF6199 family natural product biosynthesis protein n=1 Tax=Candidatus Desulfosporosinus nitrosoreducens TaxID=3401928 RepID=UPI0027E83787|nr:DUF6199 family natural product biosynthesis protein [Desulfosporosinus sp. PR]MDQ7095642.1 hypothetical protein [Desulfosporosinus sp. PR]
MNLFAIIVLILGVIAIVFPNQFFMFGRSWMFKEGAEPSKAVTYMGRIIGVILVISVLLGKFK